MYSKVIQLNIRLCIYFIQNSFYYRLLHDNEYCSLCYTIGPVFYIYVCPLHMNELHSKSTFVNPIC